MNDLNDLVHHLIDSSAYIQSFQAVVGLIITKISRHQLPNCIHLRKFHSVNLNEPTVDKFKCNMNHTNPHRIQKYKLFHENPVYSWSQCPICFTSAKMIRYNSWNQIKQKAVKLPPLKFELFQTSLKCLQTWIIEDFQWHKIRQPIVINQASPVHRPSEYGTSITQQRTTRAKDGFKSNHFLVTITVQAMIEYFCKTYSVSKHRDSEYTMDIYRPQRKFGAK